MKQQKGMKRAAKVAARKKKLVVRAKSANVRRGVRQAEVAEKELSEKSK
jgi:hypothetical protein